MAYHYRSARDERDPHKLPSIETQQFTSAEAAALWLEENDHDAIKYHRRFPLHAMSSRERDRMLAAVTDEQCIEGGWFWCSCFPGCLPDSGWFGPFASERAAVVDARDSCTDDDEDADPDIGGK